MDGASKISTTITYRYEKRRTSQRQLNLAWNYLKLRVRGTRKDCVG